MNKLDGFLQRVLPDSGAVPRTMVASGGAVGLLAFLLGLVTGQGTSLALRDATTTFLFVGVLVAVSGYVIHPTTPARAARCFAVLAAIGILVGSFSDLGPLLAVAISALFAALGFGFVALYPRWRNRQLPPPPTG